jgi:hypothetical protein
MITMLTLVFTTTMNWTFIVLFLFVYIIMSPGKAVYALIFRYFVLRLDIYVFNINTETIILSLLNEPKWFQNQLLTVLTI